MARPRQLRLAVRRIHEESSGAEVGASLPAVILVVRHRGIVLGAQGRHQKNSLAERRS
jgi:hypothetical protein